jgi:hypothetical protein
LAKCGTSYFLPILNGRRHRWISSGKDFSEKLMGEVTISLAHWLQNDYVETCELKTCADEDRQPGRTRCTKPFHRLSQLQDPDSQAQESCPSWTMQQLPRVIQDRNSIRQGSKETEVRDQNRICKSCTEPRHNTSVMAGAVRQFPFRVFVNRNRLDLLGYEFHFQRG